MEGFEQWKDLSNGSWNNSDRCIYTYWQLQEHFFSSSFYHCRLRNISDITQNIITHHTKWYRITKIIGLREQIWTAQRTLVTLGIPHTIKFCEVRITIHDIVHALTTLLPVSLVRSCRIASIWKIYWAVHTWQCWGAFQVAPWCMSWVISRILDRLGRLLRARKWSFWGGSLG